MSLPYPAALGLTVTTLAVVLGGFLLIVVPQRFVLQAGLRESGISFPVRGRLFPGAATVPVTPPAPLWPADRPAPGPAGAMRAAEERGGVPVNGVVAAALGDPRPAEPEPGLARSAADAWLALADSLQYQALDPAGAAAALERHLALRPPTEPADPALLVRLAQLSIWSGRTAEARPLLDHAIAADPPPPEAWRLLGDLHRWAGRRPAARRAYREALARAPGDTAAQAGLRTLDSLTAAARAARDPREATPGLDYFTDSDGFRRLDLAARLGTAFAAGAATARIGYRGLEGIEASGATGTARGPHAQVELARSWRDATVRAAVVAGIEELSAVAPQATVGASLELSDGGVVLRAAYDHAPAHPTTMTLESALRAVRMDRLSASVSRALGRRWSAWGSLETAALSDGAGTADNRRWSAAAAARYRAGPALRGGVTTGALGYSAAAPRAGTRPLYWDPELSWSGALFIELGPEVESGWGYRARVAPGAALVRERALSDAEVVPQLTAEVGLTYRRERVSLSADAFHARGREHGYRSSGVRIALAIRP